MEVPKHFAKFVKDYNEGTLKADDVAVMLKDEVGDDLPPEKILFAISLPLYDVFGDPTGTAHEFAITIESLVSTKQRLEEELQKATDALDAFEKTYDDMIIALQAIKDAKKAEEPKKVKP